MIPKIIHYIWIGEKDIPYQHKVFIEKARKTLKNYKFVFWTNEKVDKYLNEGPHSKFINEALKLKKYAFISDYLRLVILYDYGGVYLDTDVEVLKDFSCLLNHKIVLGNISNNAIGTAFIASEEKNEELLKWINYMLLQFEIQKHFVPNNDWMTSFFKEEYLEYQSNGSTQLLSNDIILYSKTYFESWKPFFIKDGGYCVHHCYGSWLDNNKSKNGFKRFLSKITPKFIKHILNYKKHCN